MSEVKGKDGKAIHEGDTVSGKSRGGKHAGEVEQVITTKEEADEQGVKTPPKYCSQINMVTLESRKCVNAKVIMLAETQSHWYMERTQSSDKDPK